MTKTKKGATQLESNKPFELPRNGGRNLLNLFQLSPLRSCNPRLQSGPCPSMALTVQIMFCRHSTGKGRGGTMSQNCTKQNRQVGRMK
jgi:hypothetical protein